MKTSPTQRTLAECRRLGWTAEIVERWNPHSRTRHDLFGFIDIVAMDGDGFMIGIQACAAASRAARRDKILASPHLPRWLSSADRACEVWSWGKRGDRGKRKLWTLNREAITLPTQAVGPVAV